MTTKPSTQNDSNRNPNPILNGNLSLTSNQDRNGGGEGEEGKRDEEDEKWPLGYLKRCNKTQNSDWALAIIPAPRPVYTYFRGTLYAPIANQARKLMPIVKEHYFHPKVNCIPETFSAPYPHHFQILHLVVAYSTHYLHTHSGHTSTYTLRFRGAKMNSGIKSRMQGERP